MAKDAATYEGCICKSVAISRALTRNTDIRLAELPYSNRSFAVPIIELVPLCPNPAVGERRR